MLTKRLLAGASAAAIAATGLILTTRAADAATNYAVAPYVDLSAGSADFLDTAITQGHLTAFTAAFIIASGCTPIWGDTLTPGNSTVDPRIARARSEGAQPIISFGGAGGVELGQGCTNQSSLPAATRSLITRYLARPERSEPVAPARLAGLTGREREILGLVGLGLSNEDIAARLVVSPHTVKTHVNRTMAKLAAHDRAQLVVIAYETGLIRPMRP